MRKTFTIPVLLFYITMAWSQKKPTDANLIGDVQCNGEHVPFINITIDGTTIGTTTDATGHYQITNLQAGTYSVRASGVGYKTITQKIAIYENNTSEIKFTIEEDILNLEEVVVSANRSEQKRTEAPIIVNTISADLFSSTESVTLGEGLNFSPGLRLENNCQNCGFSQVRMNGMEGPYSQILINSRPIFSGLAGVYGLELIPTTMIEKVEVVRGGGSALFGSNAIAGTINIILKEPKTNSYQAGYNYALTGVDFVSTAVSVPDYSLNFNTSIVSDDQKSGVSLYGFTRSRNMFDANNDGYSEISPMKNLTFGSRVFHRFGSRDKLAIDFFAINEERDGGNKQDYPLHERDVAEALKHNLKVAGATYERFFRDFDLFSVYASGQFLNRDSYYGAGNSLSDYGNSIDNTFNFGIQYKAVLGNSSLITGFENTTDFLFDKKLGYADYENAKIINDSIVYVPHLANTIVSEQSSITTGMFAQYDLSINRFKVSAGARFDHYEIKNFAKEGSQPTAGDVISPRLSIMYEIFDQLQTRFSYSQGYRAPQIFDEDLHIETSGSRKVIHENDLNLKQESSHSYMASFDFNRLLGTVYTGLLVEGFYTKLEDAFANEYGEPDEDGKVIYKRVNSDGGATVQGVNMEFRLKPLKHFMLTSGFTIQTSKYEKPQEDFYEKRFFRTPDQYGFIAMDWDFFKDLCLSATGNYTGSMLVPYFGTNCEIDNNGNIIGELHKSEKFYDLGLKLSYTAKLNESSVQFSGGIKNILNSYQHDFDMSADRDPAYIYGPLAPRTIYVGIKFGNIL